MVTSEISGSSGRSSYARGHGKPRLLILTTVPATIRGLLLPFARHLREEGWHVAAGARELRECEFAANEFDAVYDIPWTRKLVSWSNIAEAGKRVREIVDTEQYDIIHVHTPIASFLTRFALRQGRHSFKVVYTAHGFHFSKEYRGPGPSAFRFAEQMAARWTDRLIVINQEDFQTARETLIAPEKVTYTPGIGVDLSYYDRSQVQGRDLVRRSLGLGEDAKVFLMIAELNPGKRHRDALEAFSGISEQKTHFLCAGDGPMKGTLQNFCAERGIADRVRFLGHRNDIRELIVASDATILPSEREGLPRSIMESLAIEVPVIATNIRGSRELVDSSCGFIVPLGDVPAIRGAMQAVIDADAKTMQGMGERGRRKMQRFSTEVVLQQHMAIYRELLNELRSAS